MRCESVICSVVSNSVRPHELQPTRLLCPWNSPGKDAGVSSHFLHQGIFLTQGYVCVCVCLFMLELPQKQRIPQHNLGAYITEIYFLTVLEDKSAIRISFWQGSLLDLWIAISCNLLKRPLLNTYMERERFFYVSSSSHKKTSSIRLELHIYHPL